MASIIFKHFILNRMGGIDGDAAVVFASKDNCGNEELGWGVWDSQILGWVVQWWLNVVLWWPIEIDVLSMGLNSF